MLNQKWRIKEKTRSAFLIKSDVRGIYDIRMRSRTEYGNMRENVSIAIAKAITMHFDIIRSISFICKMVPSLFMHFAKYLRVLCTSCSMHCVSPVTDVD